MIAGNIADILGKTVKTVTYTSEEGLFVTFTDGTSMKVWGGIPRSWDVNIEIKESGATRP